MKDLDKLCEAIRVAQKLAIRENIAANAIILNKKYVKITPWLLPNAMGEISAMPPMICGLDMHFTIDELPDNYSFAILEKPLRVKEEDPREASINFAIKQLEKAKDRFIDDYINCDSLSDLHSMFSTNIDILIGNLESKLKGDKNE